MGIVPSPETRELPLLYHMLAAIKEDKAARGVSSGPSGITSPLEPVESGRSMEASSGLTGFNSSGFSGSEANDEAEPAVGSGLLTWEGSGTGPR
jgi:hypothetical protein